jgi:hypothetical protein
MRQGVRNDHGSLWNRTYPIHRLKDFVEYTQAQVSRFHSLFNWFGVNVIILILVIIFAGFVIICIFLGTSFDVQREPSRESTVPEFFLFGNVA